MILSSAAKMYPQPHPPRSPPPLPARPRIIGPPVLPAPPPINWTVLPSFPEEVLNYRQWEIVTGRVGRGRPG